MTGMTTAVVVADGRRKDTSDNIVYQRNLCNSLSQKIKPLFDILKQVPQFTTKNNFPPPPYLSLSFP